MSSGPGSVQRKIRGAFRSAPDHVFTIQDLFTAVYPEVERYEHKHRVSVLRAADAVAEQLGWLRQRHRGAVRYLSPAAAEARAARGRAKLAALTEGEVA